VELEDNFSKKLFPDNIIPEQKDIIPETMNIIPDFDRDKKKEKDKKPVVQSMSMSSREAPELPDQITASTTTALQELQAELFLCQVVTTCM